MRVEKRDGSLERRVLIGLIVDEGVLSRVASRWEKDMFKTKWGNLIGKWAIDFYNRYGKAPGKAIEGLYESWADDSKDKDTIKLVEKFLVSLSEEYETLARESNTDYIIDLASKYFNEVKVRNLIDAMQGDLDSGESEKAWERFNKTHKVEIGVGAGVDIFHNKEAIMNAFTEAREPLVRYPGALGNFFQDYLERDAFIVFEGPEKSGKTWMLLDLAFRAVRQKRKVAFFEIGDMSQNQILRRFMVRIAQLPAKPGKVKYPMFIEYDRDQLHASVDFQEREYKKALNWGKAWRACEAFVGKSKSKEKLLKLSCHPNSSLTVMGMKGVLQTWERQEGWVPDVVVVDYADLFLPVDGRMESRDAVNYTWKLLRGLSQELHCLMVTASQTDADSYNAKTITKKNFSEDKRKNAHVTGMIGINVTEEEKEQGLRRLNWVVLREGAFTEGKCVHVAGCLALANPCVKSTF